MNVDTKDANRGLYEKFTVSRNDGRSDPGEKHHGCTYYVLDLNHDPHAIPALKAYAESCRTDFPALAKDIDTIVSQRGGGTFPNAAATAKAIISIDNCLSEADSPSERSEGDWHKAYLEVGVSDDGHHQRGAGDHVSTDHERHGKGAQR